MRDQLLRSLLNRASYWPEFARGRRDDDGQGHVEVVEVLPHASAGRSRKVALVALHHRAQCVEHKASERQGDASLALCGKRA